MFSFFSFLSSSSWQSGLLHAIFLGPLGLILADVLTGVSASVKSGSFDFKQLTDFLAKDMLKYLGGGLSVGALSTGLHWSGDANLVATGLTMLGLSATVIASILSNIGEMLPSGSVVAPLIKDADALLAQAAIEQQQQQQNTMAAPVPPGAVLTGQYSSQQGQAPAPAVVPWQLSTPNL